MKNNLVIRDLISVGTTPVVLYKHFMKYFFGGDIYQYRNMLDHDHLETKGDLDDLYKMLKDNLKAKTLGEESDIYTYIKLHDVAMAGWTVISHQEFCNLETSIKFKNKYPNLFQSILVWGWG